MFDREVLRNQQLIEERIEYENDFIYIEGIIKSKELDFYTHPQFEEYYDAENSFHAQYYGEELNLEFDFEEYGLQIHEKQMIEMQESLIEAYYLEIDNEIPDYDPFKDLIEDFQKPPEPDYPDYFDAYDEYYVEEIPMDAAYCCGELVGYVVNENAGHCDYDYPEGPDENLQGVGFGEPCYFEEYEFDIPEEFHYCPEPEFELQSPYGEYLFDIEDDIINKLITDRLNEEKEFFKFVNEFEVMDKYLLPIDCDDIILC